MGSTAVSTIAMIEAACEHCGHTYTYETRVSGGAIGTDKKAEIVAEESLRRKFERQKLGYKVCPKCGYLQSWMQDQWVLQRQITLAILLIIASIPLGVLPLLIMTHGRFSQRYAEIAFIFAPVGLAGFLGYWLGRRLFVPNKRWQRKSGALPQRTIPPKLVSTRKPGILDL